MNTNIWEKMNFIGMYLQKNIYSKWDSLWLTDAIFESLDIFVPEFNIDRSGTKRKEIQMNQVTSCSSSCSFVTEPYLGALSGFHQGCPHHFSVLFYFFVFVFCFFSFLFPFFSFFFFFLRCPFGFSPKEQRKNSTMIDSGVWVENCWHQ